MTATLVLTTAIYEQMRTVASEPLETAGVLLASYVATSDGIRLLGREYHSVPDRAYRVRKVDSLGISSDGYVPALSRAEQLGAVAIWFHTHPGEGSWPSPSSWDDKVDEELAETFRLRTNREFYGTLIFSPSAGEVAFTGRVLIANETDAVLDRLWVVGDRLKLMHSFGSTALHPLAIYDRNVRAFGAPIQSALADLKVGVVGCGGTGSSVLEQLARLGVKRFLLIDPERLAPSNVTRVYGSTLSDVNAPKVEIATHNIRKIQPEASIEAIESTCNVEATAKRLSDCDIVFGCTDDNAGRLVLSRLPYYLLTPVIDMGVLLSADSKGQMTGIDGRITTLVPGHACLICRNRIDVARAGAELMTPEERRRLEGEGYAPVLGRTEPAVVTYTTAVAAAAVSELLERLVGYGLSPTPGEVLLRLHDREMSTNLAVPRSNHYCDPTGGKYGVGMSEPFLDLGWSK
ncbi:ThiF family adenylyltransferase [Variovorax sp. GB1R11]|uniref:ThiF family adenylyltransferase n=1 Tax=Variovorax sp. GB1R11 TaxID=3443741 RepID=UPI003F472611